jgi:hypothetical protein
MAGSQVPTLGAGTKMYYEPSASPGTWVHLPNALNIGEVGEQGEFLETTPISEEVREYIAGLKTPPNKDLTFNDTPGDAAYAAYLVEVRADRTLKYKVDYKNNHRAIFSVVHNGSKMEEASGSSQLKMHCFGQQTGGTDWTVI